MTRRTTPNPMLRIAVITPNMATIANGAMEVRRADKGKQQDEVWTLKWSGTDDILLQETLLAGMKLEYLVFSRWGEYILDKLAKSFRAKG